MECDDALVVSSKSSMDQIEIMDVSHYYGKTMALDGFSGILRPGITGILGENGAGKSTLLQLLATLLTPDHGTITYNGSTIDTRYYRSILGYTPQHVGAYTSMKLIDYLRYVASLKNVDGSAIDVTIKSITDSLELSDHLHDKIKTFSGGMKQRIAIAQALVNKPKVLLLDEPTVGLDPRQRILFRSLLDRYRKDTIIVLCSHIVSDIETIADQVWLIRNGQLKQSGSVDALIEPLKGHVYEMEGTIDQLNPGCTIVDVKLKPDPRVRFITDGPRAYGWKQVEPNLEDVYMNIYG